MKEEEELEEKKKKKKKKKKMMMMMMKMKMWKEERDICLWVFVESLVLSKGFVQK